MTALDVDTTVLLDYEFAPTLPCEHHAHPRRHVEHDAAAWDVLTRCARCKGHGHYALCQSGWVRMQSPSSLGCPNAMCGNTGYWDDFVVACNRIPAWMRGAA